MSLADLDNQATAAITVYNLSKTSEIQPGRPQADYHGPMRTN